MEKSYIATVTGAKDLARNALTVDQVWSFTTTVAIGKKLTAGNGHTCARLDSGQVKCCGNNDSGQLGLGDNTDVGDFPGEMGDNLPAVDLGP